MRSCSNTNAFRLRANDRPERVAELGRQCARAQGEGLKAKKTASGVGSWQSICSVEIHVRDRGNRDDRNQRQRRGPGAKDTEGWRMRLRADARVQSVRAREGEDLQPAANAGWQAGFARCLGDARWRLQLRGAGVWITQYGHRSRGRQDSLSPLGTRPQGG